MLFLCFTYWVKANEFVQIEDHLSTIVSLALWFDMSLVLILLPVAVSTSNPRPTWKMTQNLLKLGLTHYHSLFSVRTHKKRAKILNILGHPSMHCPLCKLYHLKLNALSLRNVGLQTSILPCLVPCRCDIWESYYAIPKLLSHCMQPIKKKTMLKIVLLQTF